ncbi:MULTISPECIES: hypothetical protein [unclassified Streptosporangium]|uniref:hypothetical protein n=1 Tax=unclassified Streptosporangium TaxID=2632669 RepID=UPI002E2E7AA6|nr:MULTISPECIES: hypothetical protein [unclassified Streptosporangium]
MAEFDALFTKAVHGVERIDPLRLWLRLDAVLIEGHLSLEINVPARHGERLNAVAARVEAVTGRAGGDIDDA